MMKYRQVEASRKPALIINSGAAIACLLFPPHVEWLNLEVQILFPVCSAE